MTSRILVVDAGGTTRLVKAGRFFVVDSGGVSRQIKRAFVIDSGGVARQIYVAAGLVTTLTVGNATIGYYYTHDGGITIYYPNPVGGYGYDGGGDPYGAPNFGSMANNVFFDGGGVARTIVSTYWTGNNPFTSDTLYFVVNGSGLPNSDSTFQSIVINGNTFNRSAASYNNVGPPPGTTLWSWTTGANPFGTSGTIPFEVRLP